LVAKELQEEGYSQTEIADTLDLTQPAVSQYLNAARGRKVQRIEESPELYTAVQDLVDLLESDAPAEDVSKALCDTCLQIRASGVFDDTADHGSADTCLLQDA
ncbi:MAG: transcriptional regulator, partial [Candidatus Nanohaloarchaea archaeon]